MPVTYTPEFSYYNGNKNPIEGDFFIFNFGSDSITIYHFLTKNIEDISTANAEVFSANTFFEAEIPFSSNPINMKNVNIAKPPYINHVVTPMTIQLVDNFLLSYEDVAGRFNLVKNSRSQFNTNNLYLLPNKAVKIPFFAFEVCGLEPNLDVTISFDREKFSIRNKNENGKVVYPSIPITNWTDILTLNSGFGNNTNFDSFNIIVNPFIGSFMTNKTNLTTYTETITRQNYNLIPFNNRLKLKVTGPSSGNVGDVLEYTVTLMDKSFTNTFSNAPATLECYPSIDAGELSHRKVVLKNGVGKFKVDTKNLYAGDSFDVKIGWKYITSDSKVSVTVS